MTPPRKMSRGMAANISCAARNENSHEVSILIERNFFAPTSLNAVSAA
jgi:hypothetical protein